MFDSKLKELENLRQQPGLVHPRLGDLARPNAVIMGKPLKGSRPEWEEEETVIIHVTITGRCYANCKGCINAAITHSSDQPRHLMTLAQEAEPRRDAQAVIHLASRYPHQPAVVYFYGGEPFLAADKMEEMRKILSSSPLGPRIRYAVYTNGELLTQAMDLYPGLMKEIWLYSVAIDGDEEQHQRVRRGTNLARIIHNLEQLQPLRRGTVLHWSTLREEQSLLNCFEQFLDLYERDLVDQFFWHWLEAPHPFQDFATYAMEYGRHLEKIMETYVNGLTQGRLLPIVHVNELVLHLISGKQRGHSACAVELAKNYDLMNGRVYACADLPDYLAIGELNRQGRPRLREHDLTSLVKYKHPLGCYQCGVHAYCGGRCPVQALSGSPQRTVQYCQLMRLHVGIIQERIDEIVKAMENKALDLQYIYRQSAFLARYTDVTP